MIEKTIKIGTKAYEGITALADQGALSKAEVASALVDAGIKQLPKLEDLLKHLEVDAKIKVQEVNGKVYYCEDCNYPLDPHEELEECVNCGTKLSWSEIDKPGGGLGFLGWSLIGLAALVFVNAQRRTNQF